MRRFCLTTLVIAILSAAAVGAEQAAAETKLSPEKINNFALKDFRGKQWSLDDFKEKKLVVVAFLGVECPLVKLYAKRLGEVEQAYKDRSVAVIGINSNQQDSLAEIAHFARTYQVSFPLLKDPGNAVADQFKATRTPEIFLLDANRKIRYRGRVDDQYTYGLQRPKVTHNYLIEALDALLAGKQIEHPATETVGCHIGRVLKPNENSDVVYSRQISRIMQRSCVECHREGEIAPFPLTTYEETLGWAEMIHEVVREQRMPPWHANPKHGDFANDARLSDEEKEDIRRWVRAGAPEGDPQDLPAPREFEKGWRIGKPDEIFFMDKKPFAVQAEGEVKYQYFLVDPGFEEDKWIKAAECRPDNRAVVHHIIVGVQPPHESAEGVHGLRSAWLTATAPGGRPMILADGRAKFVPAGSKLIFQMHYTPIGTPQKDRSSVGFIYADSKEVKQQVATHQAINTKLRIPAGADNHKVEASYTFRKDSLMLAMFPHMHLRGKSFRYTAIYPNGEREILLDVPGYDFNWQNGYEFAKPKKMPAGTRLLCTAHYDNSENNFANPDPTVAVRWGDQTWDEMMIGYFDIALIDQDVQKKTKKRTARFLENLKSGPMKPNAAMKKLLAEALGSPENFHRFAAQLQKIAPQLDRVCWTTVEDKKLHVRLAANSPTLGGGGRSGLAVPAAGLRLTQYAQSAKPAVNQNLAKITTPDFRLMKRWFKSSLHIPVRAQGKQGSINFWSSDEDAFPQEAVELLRKAAKKMAQGE